MTDTITFRVPTRPLSEAEVGSLAAGVCVYIPRHGHRLGAREVLAAGAGTLTEHLHIGAPVDGQSTVPVLRFEDQGLVRYELDTGEAAALLADIPPAFKLPLSPKENRH